MPEISVVIITRNEEANLPRTLASVQPLVESGRGEIIVVDSGSTDRTVELAKEAGAKIFVEEWKGFAAQKRSAIEKASGDWILSLDADEDLGSELPALIDHHLRNAGEVNGFWLLRQNIFLGRALRYGGTLERKLRIFRKGKGRIKDVPVHEVVLVEGKTSRATLGYGDEDLYLHHHAYPTLEVYLEHLRRYADLGAELKKNKPRWWLRLNRRLNPPLTFFYNYVVRLGFLDGREGFLFHWHHARYVRWKYERALELTDSPRSH